MTPPSPGQACPADQQTTKPAAASMQILLRDLQKGLLYAGDNGWSDCWDQAVCFENVTTAIDYATAVGLSSAEVVMRFLNPPLVIPLRLVNPRNQ